MLIWAMIYMQEVLMINVIVIFILFIDLLLITMCVMFVDQFETLSALYESFGQLSHRDQPFHSLRLRFPS